MLIIDAGIVLEPRGSHLLILRTVSKPDTYAQSLKVLDQGLTMKASSAHPSAETIVNVTLTAPTKIPYQYNVETQTYLPQSYKRMPERTARNHTQDTHIRKGVGLDSSGYRHPSRSYLHFCS